MTAFPFAEPEMDKLPVEVLEIVFGFLPREERKVVVRVNSRWRKAGEAAHLWAWVLLPTVEDQNSCTRVINMLRCERLARVEEIVICASAVSENLLQAVLLHKGLKRMRMEIGKDYKALPAGMYRESSLIEALTRVDSLDLQIGALPFHGHVLIDLLTKLTTGCSLNELYLRADKKDAENSGVRLARKYSPHVAKVPASLLASAFTRLVKVQLTHTMVTSDQVAALMEKISEGNSSLTKFSLVEPRLQRSEETGPLNLKPLVNLDEVQVVGRFFKEEELAGFIEALSPSTKVKKMELGYCFWGEEEGDSRTDAIAKAINFLEDVKMESSSFQVCTQASLCCAFAVTCFLLSKTEFQLNAILRHSLQFTKLQHIHFLGCNSDDEEIDQGILNAARRVIPNIMISEL